jgi:hypothetical protein
MNIYRLGNSTSKEPGMPRLRNYITAVVAFIAIGCGKADQTRSWDGGKGDNFNLDQNQPAAGIANKWHGGLKDKREDAPTKLMPASLVLNQDKTFLITLDEVPSAGAGGTYIQFQDTILFTITKSALSIFGLAGSQRDMNYSLFGNTLTVFDKQVELKLEVAGASSVPGPGEVADNDPILGKWQGRDKRNNDWYLDLITGRAFTARVENEASNALHLEGTIDFVPDSNPERAALITTKRNNPDTEPMKIVIEYSVATKKLKVIISKVISETESEEVQFFYMTKI